MPSFFLKLLSPVNKSILISTIYLELVDDFVLLLMPFILGTNGLHVTAVISLLDLFLRKYRVGLEIWFIFGPTFQFNCACSKVLVTVKAEKRHKLSCKERIIGWWMIPMLCFIAGNPYVGCKNPMWRGRNNPSIWLRKVWSIALASRLDAITPKRSNKNKKMDGWKNWNQKSSSSVRIPGIVVQKQKKKWCGAVCQCDSLVVSPAVRWSSRYTRQRTESLYCWQSNASRSRF